VTATGRYLFAVTRGLVDGDLADVTGLRGAPLEVVERDGLQGVVCDVSLDEFGEEALPRNLEDLAWVEEVARSHDDVVRAVASRATVAPMRLVTIYASDTSVQGQLDDLRGKLLAALDRVEDCGEWSVKVYSTSAVPGPTAPTGEKVTSGAAYLQRKRDQAEARRTADDHVAQVAEQVYAALSEYVTAGRRLALQDPRLSGRAEMMILNAAYLVPHNSSEAFQATAETLSERYSDAAIEVQGPWPPYSFAMLE
jgi:hypothetical protein